MLTTACLIKNNLVKSPFSKIRIGKEFDGGYVICPDFKYDCVLGCGISDDVSFENDLLNRIGKVPCYLFDGTIENIPVKREEFTFIKKNIGEKETDFTTNLGDYMKEYRSIFLKMDIEGGEYDWFRFLDQDESTRNLLDNVTQIVLEIHSLNVKNELAKSLLKLLFEYFYAIHIHGNNCCWFSTPEPDGCHFFNVFEITLLNKRCFNKIEFSNEEFPTSYDMKNTLHNQELYLYTYPFYERIVRCDYDVYKISPWNSVYNDKFEFDIVKNSEGKRWLIVSRDHPWGQNLQVRMENVKNGKVKILPCGVSNRNCTVYKLDSDI